MSLRFKPSLLAVAILLATPAAQATGLLDVYRQALDSDPDIRAASQDRLATRENEPQARALLLPDISATGEQTRDFGVDSTGSSDSNFSGHSYSLNLTQPIYRRTALVRQDQAAAQVKQADATFSAEEQNLVLRVARAYFDVLSAQDDLSFSQAEKQAIARQLEQATRRFEVGLITITDVQEAQARFDQSTADEIVAENAVANAYEALRQITNLRYDTIDVLSESLPLESPEPADPEIWVRQALDNNPALIGAAFGVDVARENIEIQRSDHYPTVDLTAGYYDTESGSSGFASDTSGAQIGLQVNVPLYKGGAVVSRTREAAYQFEASKARLEASQREAVRQVREAYRNVLAAISTIDALRQALKSSESALEATEAGFEVGTRTIVDVLDAQRAVFDARRNLSQARYAYVLNHLSLDQAAGQLDETSLAEVDRHLVAP